MMRYVADLKHNRLMFYRNRIMSDKLCINHYPWHKLTGRFVRTLN